MAEYLNFNIHLIQDGLVLNKNSRPTDYMIFEIANCMANFYPRNLSIDVLTKLREKAEQGYYPERPPVGYMRKPNLKRAYLQINPDKAPLIKRVFELYSTGLYSYTTLAKQLREEGFSISPSVKVGRCNVEDILNNPIYIGDFIFKGKRYYNAKHDPIVSREIYAACQRIIAEHTNFKPNQRDFLFSNMIKSRIVVVRLRLNLKRIDMFIIIVRATVEEIAKKRVTYERKKSRKQLSTCSKNSKLQARF